MTRDDRETRVAEVRAALARYVGHNAPDTTDAQDLMTDLLLLVATEGGDIAACARLAKVNAAAEWAESEADAEEAKQRQLRAIAAVRPEGGTR